MDIIRFCAWGYAALLGFVILTGYIPAFIDANDMIFGLFRRTWYADGLHLVSALWAATAAFTSRRASELFFQLFGVFYFADGVLGLLTGSTQMSPQYPEHSVLIAEDLTPSDTATMEGGAVVGFATVRGGATSHVAILARSLGIPAIAGIEPRALEVAVERNARRPAVRRASLE